MVLDLTDDFRGLSAEDAESWFAHEHRRYSNKGNRAVAEMIYAKLISLGETSRYFTNCGSKTRRKVTGHGEDFNDSAEKRIWSHPMCGIAGIIDPSMTRDQGETVLQKMLESIRHRGPDNSSTWVEMPVLL